MNTYVPSWADLKASWSAGWKQLSEQATTSYASALRADPTGTAARITGFATALQQTRATLDRIGPRLPNPPTSEADRALVIKYQYLERRWRELAAGFYADASPVPEPSVGVAPVLVIGGLAITAVGVAWAFAAYEYAANLQEQTALAERELEARVAASQQGRVLPPSTLPPALSPANGARSLGLWLFGGLALAAGVLVVPLLMERR